MTLPWDPPSMNIGRFGPTATSLPNGKMLLAGGNSERGSPLALTAVYTPSTNSFCASKRQHKLSLWEIIQIVLLSGRLRRRRRHARCQQE